MVGGVCCIFGDCLVLMIISGATIIYFMVVVLIISFTLVVILGVVGKFGVDIRDYYSSVVLVAFNMSESFFIVFDFFPVLIMVFLDSGFEVIG